MKMNEIEISNIENQLSNELPMGIIVYKLKKIFQNKIGRNNAIMMNEIYAELYNDMVSKYHIMYRITAIQRAMTWLKKKTPYFIVGEQFEDAYKWYIIKSEDEAKSYKASVSSQIKGLEYMKARCDLAVASKFYQQVIEDVPQLRTKVIKNAIGAKM